MATDGWKKLKQENPVLLCKIKEMLFRHLLKFHIILNVIELC